MILEIRRVLAEQFQRSTFMSFNLEFLQEQDLTTRRKDNKITSSQIGPNWPNCFTRL